MEHYNQGFGYFLERGVPCTCMRENCLYFCLNTKCTGFRYMYCNWCFEEENSIHDHRPYTIPRIVNNINNEWRALFADISQASSHIRQRPENQWLRRDLKEDLFRELPLADSFLIAFENEAHNYYNRKIAILVLN